MRRVLQTHRLWVKHGAAPVLPHITEGLAEVLLPATGTARQDLALVEEGRDTGLVTLQEEVGLGEASLVATWREYLVRLGLLHVDGRLGEAMLVIGGVSRRLSARKALVHGSATVLIVR